MATLASLVDFSQESESESCIDFTFKQRMLAFAGCAIIGLLSGIFSIISISMLNIRKFSILFSIFNIMMFSSTGFLIGFKSQFKSLLKEKRIYSFIVMIIGIVATLYFAIKRKSLVGVIISFIIEFLSFLYYSLSYIPFGKQIFHKLII